ncbi:transcriptional regulator BetI [Aestuariivirga litoralis]|uniref:Transcriptional regulator BetI n=1 Tax=Aestuariivirga litoralis TaxID=2650924 RepID=A0A2W2BBC3_9HYPH|nr:transcriptional regulator BetI [Aestuariivirga litoralis]
MTDVAATRTSIEKIRRQDLIEAAYQTFLEHGFTGMTVVRIGERAGMSHGIVNYYFKSKDELVSAVVRKANFLIMQDTARRLRAARSARQRVSAVIAGNFPPDLFTREIARAWVSYYAALGRRDDLDRMQRAVDARLASNLLHALVQLVSRDEARRIASYIAVLIDGYWLRHTKPGDTVDAARAIAAIESFVDSQLPA